MRLRSMLWMLFGLAALPLQAAPAAPRVAMSQPSVSPNGSEIAFVADGGIWAVASTGGKAHLLVADDGGADSRPLYSPDGKQLAFQSDTGGEGSGIYLLDLASGVLRRLTWADGSNQLDAWSRDSQWIYLSSSRDNVGGMAAVYRVRASGGTPMPVSLESYRNESMAAPSPDGKQLALVGGGMGDWQWWRHGRAHIDEGAVWLLRNDGSHQYRQLTPDGARAEWPMWSPDGGSLYYMSDRGGTENIWRVPLADGSEAAVTRFSDGRVLWPSLSADGRVMAFERDFGIWTLNPASGEAQALPIELAGAIRGPLPKQENLSRGFSQIALSPDGKKLALIAHGEVFATDAAKGGHARRITRTAAAEYDLAWAPDSRRLVYGSERNGHGQLFLYDFVSGKETALTRDDGEDTAPQFSPDGKQLAFLRNDRELCVLDIASGKLRSLVHAAIDLPRPLDSTQPYAWSPDGHWIAYLSWGQRMFRNVQAVNLADGKSVTLSSLANTDADNVLWNPDRSSLLFTTGQRTEEGRIAQVDLLPRTPEFREDRFQDLFKTKSTGDDKQQDAHAKPESRHGDTPVRIDASAIRERLSLLPVGLDVGAAQISPDGKTLLLTAEVAGKPNLYSWSLDPLAKEPPVAKQLTSTPGNKQDAQFSHDGKRVFYLDAGRIQSLTLGDDKAEPLDVDASMEVDFDSEKTVVFEQAWSWLRNTFHDPKMHGVDWNQVHATYAPLVATAATPAALYRLLNLMVGELDASHSGARAPQHREPITGRLGLSFDRSDYEQHGRFRIDSVLPLSPADVAGGIKPGDYLLAIDGEPLDAHSNLAERLAHRIGDKVGLRIASSASGTDAHTVAVKPIDSRDLGDLAYRAWTASNRAYVLKASGGRLGYVHLRDMSGDSLLDFYKDLDAQNATREGVVIDIRNNFGGFVNAYALDVLSRRPYLNMTFRGFDQAEPARSILGQRALERPTVLITNRVTLSDGEDFSEGYRALGLGKVVGEPTAGWIIYTSAGKLIDGGAVRLPFITITDNHGQPMEGHPRPVDIPVTRPLGESYQHKDSDLDAAVHSLLPTAAGSGKS
ncbi:MAG TPA: S41 family peptidase [Rhodanobacter sp.]|nr:S41 family peptidase [Rhodanobacter sp.]